MQISKIVKYLKIKFFWITLERYPNIFRPSSIPYLSGDSLRRYSNFIFDEIMSFDPHNVKTNDVIFVNTDVLEIFFKTHHPKIQNRYLLITHNSDKEVNEETFKFYDEKIIHWFAQNLNMKNNDKISVIPIGLENLRRLKNGRKKWFKKKFNNKTKYILGSYNIYTNFEARSKIQDILKSNDLVTFKNFEQTNEYFREINNYKFILCPRGNGIDTHRIWESLLLGIFPILILDTFTNNLKDLGVPGIYIQSWEDLNSFSDDKLNNLYNKLLTENYTKYSLFEFWEKSITSKLITD